MKHIGLLLGSLILIASSALQGNGTAARCLDQHACELTQKSTRNQRPLAGRQPRYREDQRRHIQRRDRMRMVTVKSGSIRVIRG